MDWINFSAFVATYVDKNIRTARDSAIMKIACDTVLI